MTFEEKIKSLIVLIIIFSLITGCDIFLGSKIENLENNTRWIESKENVLFLKGGELHKIQINGNNHKKLLDEKIYSYLMSPDGEKIAFTRLLGNDEKECGVLNLSSLKEYIVNRPCESIDWCPKSRYVSYKTDDHNLFIYDTTLQVHKKVSESEDIIVGPRWSMSGLILYFNTLFCKEYYQLDLMSEEIQKIGVGIPSQERIKTKKRTYWHDFVNIEDMHFNQSSISYRTNRAISPTGTRELQVQRGSLFIIDKKMKSKKELLTNLGGYNSDFNITGFSDPIWTSNEKYALGEYKKQIIVVEIDTSRAGILTEGYNPLTYIAKYYPKAKINSPMYYMSIE